MEDIRAWAGPLAALLALGNVVYTFLTQGSKANEARIDAQESKIGTQLAKLTDHDRRIQTLENELGHLPTREDFSELRLVISELNGKLGRLEESHLGVSRAVRRIEEFLLKEKTR